MASATNKAVQKRDKKDDGKTTRDETRLTMSGVAEEMLVAIRKIVQTVTIHSKQLYRETGLTIPQLLCLKQIAAGKNEITPAELSRRVQLSPATVTGILDRLERDGWVKRERHTSDRRKICLLVTPKTEAKLENLPPLLQDKFVARVLNLPQKERTQLVNALKQVVDLMEASSLDASPILTFGDVKTPPEI